MLKARQRSYKVIAVFDLEDVLPYIANGPEDRDKFVDYVVDDETFEVRMGSDRMRLLKRCPWCICCGLKGIQFQLELPPRTIRPHFNLYGMNTRGSLVMLTKDHIIPRSAGGNNHPGNLQTLCCECNELKSSHRVSIVELRAMRMKLEHELVGQSLTKEIKC